jgi:hypothetical protein
LLQSEPADGGLVARADSYFLLNGGNDFLNGGGGTDPLDGDTGIDDCVNGEPELNCKGTL